MTDASNFNSASAVPSRIALSARPGLRAVAAVLVTLLAGPPASAKDKPAATPDGTCSKLPGVAVLTSPMTPWTGAPLRVIVAADAPLSAKLTLTGPDGSSATHIERSGTGPFHWIADIAKPDAGQWTATLALDAETEGCKSLPSNITVRKSASGGPGSSSKSVWPLRGHWDRAMENLYSTWIEALFDAPPDASPSWPALHEVLRDPSRNLLINHLGLREDDKGIVYKPDCADLPYFLRGYFAFKLGLPFGYSKCTRGGRGKPPQCVSWWNIEKLEPPPPDPNDAKPQQPGLLDGLFGGPAPAPDKPKAKPQGLAQSFGTYIGETVANAVHSGGGRTPLPTDQSDYYPIALSAQTLRPGATYMDPYGHILVVVKRVAQTADKAGLIYAVDGQPDGTVARKRFWRGNFLFAKDAALGGPGFKRFRPIMRGKSGLRRLTNAEIAKHAEYGDFSLEQSELDIETFYDRMDDVMSPDPLDPQRAMTEAIDALEEQVKARVTSVENGRKFLERGGTEVAIPAGPAIFETTGAWEDFATPSRDLRLLIAIDVVRGFPDRVARRPERYAMPKDKTPEALKSELEAKLAADLATRAFSYTRSDGSEWKLTVKDVLERREALEMAYNINDCVELRWGAGDGSDEAKTCKRQASTGQRAKMTEYRAWFSERRRPPRG